MSTMTIQKHDYQKALAYIGYCLESQSRSSIHDVEIKPMQNSDRWAVKFSVDVPDSERYDAIRFRGITMEAYAIKEFPGGDPRTTITRHVITGYFDPNDKTDFLMCKTV